jgi:mono/diheme cytochrome c family protein
MLIAWDPVAQREVWRADRPTAWNGGTLATAGGLVFQGTGDGRFLALDARTGKEVWSTDNQAATLAGPVTYEVGGEQHVAVLGGYGSAFFLVTGFLAPEGRNINGRVYAFKLGGAAARPVLGLQKITTPRPPVVPIDAKAYNRSGYLYEGNCAICHGVSAVSGGVLPDLRRSPRLQDAIAWRRAVVDGDLAPAGMPRFGKYVTPADAELIRAYVAKQAAILYEAEGGRPK